MLGLYPVVDNNTWLLIFHHYSKNGYFNSHKEALYSIKKDKFSILEKIDDSFKIDGTGFFAKKCKKWVEIERCLWYTLRKKENGGIYNE